MLTFNDNLLSEIKDWEFEERLSKESGNKSLISFDSPVDLPSVFALTGSKSINQDLKSIFAICSRFLQNN